MRRRLQAIPIALLSKTIKILLKEAIIRLIMFSDCYQNCQLEQRFCCGLTVATEADINDKNSCFCMKKFNSSILLCGKLRSHFPFQCFVGPDWPIVIVVYALIVIVDVVALTIISPLGWPVVLIGGVGALVVLLAYSAVACTDPGIIYAGDYPKSNTTDTLEEPTRKGDVESTGSISIPMVTKNTVMPNVPTPNTNECGHCKVQRPYRASHCIHCKQCVHDLVSKE